MVLCDSTSSVVNRSRADSHGLSAKQALMFQQKSDAARRVREEKARLKEEKVRRQEAFLKRSAEKREQLEQQLEARRLAMQHETNAALASKELEISDRQWRLEQERLHRLEMEAKYKASARAEQEMKAKIREERLAAELREKEKIEAERRRDAMQQADELQHQMLLIEFQRMQKLIDDSDEAICRQEAGERVERDREEALQRMQELRALSEEAHSDLMVYLEKEKQRRRESLAVRIMSNKSWKQQQADLKALERIHERKDREIELQACEDMKKYLTTAQEDRRQSLADFLQQESDYRKLKELEKDRLRQTDPARLQEDVGKRDAAVYLKIIEEKRRMVQIVPQRNAAVDLDIHSNLEKDRKIEMDALDRQVTRLAAETEDEHFERIRAEERARKLADKHTLVKNAKKTESLAERKLREFENAKMKNLVSLEAAILKDYPFLSEGDTSTLGDHENISQYLEEEEQKHNSKCDGNTQSNSKSLTNIIPEEQEQLEENQEQQQQRNYEEEKQKLVNITQTQREPITSICEEDQIEDMTQQHPEFVSDSASMASIQPTRPPPPLPSTERKTHEHEYNPFSADDNLDEDVLPAPPPPVPEKTYATQLLQQKELLEHRQRLLSEAPSVIPYQMQYQAPAPRANGCCIIQ